jgi:formylglycine-generating enzyme required for sulfatase activity
MNGNVWEWCWDIYSSGDTYRVLRGGAWSETEYYCRVYSRENYYPYSRTGAVGFRVVCNGN